ncbi:MAG TPA: winged helix DNA-binding domain-containing protein, partial [Actinopolymorphaceae bacterium]
MAARRPSADDRILRPRELNRALLARQFLLERTNADPLDVVDHLIGLQAQAVYAPYTGLWTRIADFSPEALSRLLVDRRVVRIAVMRGTVHLVTAADALELRALMRPVFERPIAGGTPYSRALAGVDLQQIVARARALVEERPRTHAELRALLGEHWPDVDPGALTFLVRHRLACVQVPPRGVWGAKGQPRVTTAEAWLGRPLSEDPSAETLVQRYLAAYGPASVADMQAWSSLTRLGGVFERIRPRLVTFRTDDGRELFDLPDAPRPSAEVTAPVRFLPEYDNVLRAHADRSRVMSAETRERLRTKNDAPRPTFLVDGFVHGTWRIEQRRGTATMTIQPFRALSRPDTSAVT